MRDSVGNLLEDGDQITLIKYLTVNGAGKTLKRLAGQVDQPKRRSPGNRQQNMAGSGVSAARRVYAQTLEILNKNQ